MSDESKRKTKKAAAAVVPETSIFDVDSQVQSLTIRETAKNSRNFNGVYYSTMLKKGSSGGMIFPVVRIDDAPLGLVGKSSEQRRGVEVVEFKLNNGAKGAIAKVAIGISRDSNPGLFELCKSAWTQFCGMRDPIKNSQWFQGKFPSLNDGTKVHFATVGMDSHAELATMEIEDDKLMWSSPARTYGPAMFGDDDTARWYTKLNIGDDYSVYCYRPNGKPHGKVTEFGVPVYTKDGVAVSATNLLKNFVQSSFYQKHRWSCTTVVQLCGMEICCGTRSRFDDTGNPKYGVFPVFNLRIVSPVVLQEEDDTMGQVGLTAEQRDAAIVSYLFSGKQMPAKKRKVRDASQSNGQDGTAKAKKRAPETRVVGESHDAEEGDAIHDDDEVDDSGNENEDENESDDE